MQLLNQGSAPALLLAVPSLQLLVKGPVEKRTGRLYTRQGCSQSAFKKLFVSHPRGDKKCFWSARSTGSHFIPSREMR